MSSNPLTIRDVLTTMWHAANMTPYDKDSVVDVVGPSVDEAIAAIDQLVRERVIGENGVPSRLFPESALIEKYQNTLRGKQRGAWKQLLPIKEKK